jgi:phage terminase large subunit
MRTNPLFLKLQNCNKKYIVLQGGGDAGKTVAILQRLCIKSIEQDGILTTVTGQTVPAIKAGSLHTFQKYVLPDFAKYIVKYNESERVYTFWNRSKIEFKSYQDELRAQGAERENLFINECNHETYNTFWQLQRKTRHQIFLDYNPTSKFWVHEKILPLTIKGEENTEQERAFKGKVQFYLVDHRHNLYLSQEEHDNYENISDPDLFAVYSRGKTGKIKGLVFGHFKKHSSILLPDKAIRYYYGIDYGYTNDPTAIVKVSVGGEGLTPRHRVVKELAYETGLPAETIKTIIMNSGWSAGQSIYSEADPNMINQLRSIAIPAEPAIKGPGSLAAGISKVRERECYYTPDSLNLEAELGVYKWVEAEDIVTGKTIMTNVPMDSWNHACDAMRMGEYTDSFRHRSL